MADDIIMNKVQTIERCLKRIEDVYAGDPTTLIDFTKQDSIILNIQRASEASIDLAMHTIAKNKLGVPQTSREAFELLLQANLLDKELAEKMKAMVGFRNIAIHDYQTINLNIIEQIINKHLVDFKDFTKTILDIK